MDCVKFITLSPQIHILKTQLGGNALVIKLANADQGQGGSFRLSGQGKNTTKTSNYHKTKNCKKEN